MARRQDDHRLGRVIDLLLIAHDAEKNRLGCLYDTAEKNYDETLSILDSLCKIAAIRRLIPDELAAKMRPYVHLEDYE